MSMTKNYKKNNEKLGERTETNQNIESESRKKSSWRFQSRFDQKPWLDPEIFFCPNGRKFEIDPNLLETKATGAGGSNSDTISKY